MFKKTLITLALTGASLLAQQGTVREVAQSSGAWDYKLFTQSDGTNSLTASIGSPLRIWTAPNFGWSTACPLVFGCNPNEYVMTFTGRTGVASAPTQFGASSTNGYTGYVAGTSRVWMILGMSNTNLPNTTLPVNLGANYPNLFPGSVLNVSTELGIIPVGDMEMMNAYQPGSGVWGGGQEVLFIRNLPNLPFLVGFKFYAQAMVGNSIDNKVSMSNALEFVIGS